jgi:hypothetical protein
MIVIPTIVAYMLFVAMVNGLLLLTMTLNDDNGDVSEKTKRRGNDEKKLLVNGKEKENKD